jgi:hypothetical protein
LFREFSESCFFIGGPVIGYSGHHPSVQPAQVQNCFFSAYPFSEEYSTSFSQAIASTLQAITHTKAVISCLIDTCFCTAAVEQQSERNKQHGITDNIHRQFIQHVCEAGGIQLAGDGIIRGCKTYSK